ncbi:UNVERIFIED_CONTAM: hypothetical protein Sindi_0738100 [Sesamum indicum]
MEYDPEFEKTAQRLRWETKQQSEGTSAPYKDGKDITLEFEESSSESREEIMALIPKRSIKDMTSPDLNQQPLCIEYPNLENATTRHKRGTSQLRAFPFSLAYQTKDWFYFLPSRSITRWNDLKREFLEKYFPASRATMIRKEMSGIRQFAGESLFEYWGRFNELVESCPIIRSRTTC